MTHEEENAVMNGLEKHGWLFEAESPGKISFWTPEDANGDRKYWKFNDWEEAKKHLESL